VATGPRRTPPEMPACLAFASSAVPSVLGGDPQLPYAFCVHAYYEA